MKTINDYAYKSSLKNIPPTVKIAFSFATIILCIALNSFYVGIFTILFMGLLSNLTSRITRREYLLILMIPITFILLSIFPILLNISTSHTFQYGVSVGKIHIGTNDENIQLAAVLIAKALGAVSCMYFLSLSTTMNDLFLGFRKMKLPSIVIALMELIYRYIYVLFEEAKKISTAQHARLGYQSFSSSFVCTAKLISALFIKTYTRCDRVYHALLARGYDNKLEFMEKEYSKSKKLHYMFFLYVGVVFLVFYIEKRWF